MSEIETFSLLFDSAWYLATYQDVAAANCDPLEHYLNFGYKEGRNPNRFFDTHFYLTMYPDLASCHLNPFIHYILYGASEGRLPRPPHQPPLPMITFDLFLQEEAEFIEAELSQTSSEAVKVTKEDTIDIKAEKNIAPVAPPKSIKKESKPAAEKAEKAKKTVRKPTPRTKSAALAKINKKAAQAS